MPAGGMHAINTHEQFQRTAQHGVELVSMWTDSIQPRPRPPPSAPTTPGTRLLVMPFGLVCPSASADRRLMARAHSRQAVAARATCKGVGARHNRPCGPTAMPACFTQTVQRRKTARRQRITASRGAEVSTTQLLRQSSTPEGSLTQMMFERMQAATQGGGQGD